MRRWSRLASRFVRGVLVLVGLSPGLVAPVLAQGRILASGGVTQIEGSAGGGLVPWALIGGYGTRDEIGATASYTYLDISDFRLQSASAAVGFFDRVEVSLAHERFDLGSTVPGQSIRQDIAGIKVRAFGDAVYDQDRWWPQVAFGAQYKHNPDYAFIPRALGARRSAGTDFYVAATKVYLAGLIGRNVLVDGTLRATRANQLGLLGFGGDLDDRYRVVAEGSVAVFLTDRIGIGYEYRQKPNNLGAFREQAFQDAFVAWLPNKHVAATVAYTRLGTIANQSDQRGLYLSAQVSY